MDLKKLFDFQKKIDAVMVLSISEKLKFINVELIPEIKVNAVETIDLPSANKNEAVINSLRDFISKNNISHKNIIINLPLSSFQIKRLNLPAMPQSELASAIKLQIKDELDFDVNQTLIDFRVIKKVSKEDGSKTVDVICAITKQDTVMELIGLLKQLGLNMLAINALPFSFADLISNYISVSKEEIITLLYLDMDCCFISIYKDNNLYFFRELPISIKNIKSALTGAMVSDKGRIELSLEEVEDILFKVGIPIPTASYKDKISSVQLLGMVRPHLERMSNEIKRSLIYYESQYKEGKTNKIFICGLGAKVMGLDKFLREGLALEVQALSFLDKIEISDGIDKQKLSEEISDIASVFDFERNINLLPLEYRHKKFEEAEKISLRMAAFIAFLILAFSFIFAKVQIDGYKKRLEASSIHLNVLSEFKRINERSNALNNLLKKIKGSDISSSLILNLLSSLTPRELFFKEFIFDRDSNSGTIKGFIRITNQNPELILSNFMRDLENSKIFTEMSLSSVEKSQEDGVSISNFQMSFKVQK